VYFALILEPIDEGQATDVKFTTDNAIGSVMKPDYHEAKPIRIKNSKALVDRTTNRKMPSFSQPDLPHRAVQNLNSVQLPPSLDGDLSFDLSSTDYCHLTHPSRVSNSTKIARTMNTRINFPASNDKIWKKIDEELELLIPKLFNKRLINKLTTSELSQNFDAWLHQFFLNKFGEKKELNAMKNGYSRQKRPNKALQHLRNRKKQCKAAQKALLKAGLKDSPEEENIHREWFLLVCQHGKCISQR